MFNLLLALMAGIIIGWSFHAFFIALDKATFIPYRLNSLATLQKIPIEKNTLKLKKRKKEHENKEKLITLTKSNSEKDSNASDTNFSMDRFNTLLYKNYFSDAMALYLDASEKDIQLYKVTLLNYFKKKTISETEIAIDQMLEFIELEPVHEKIVLLLIETYRENHRYQEAINLLVDERDTPTINQEKFDNLLLLISQEYIDRLYKRKNFFQLITFLEEQVQIGIHLSFYSFNLAKYYVELEKYYLAKEYLEDILYDESYKNRVENLLTKIELKINENKDYLYQFPLQKVGEYYMIEVEVEEIPLTLILDTGASLSLIDSEKIEFLKTIKEKFSIDTAGGKVTANLKEAKRFNIAELQIENFKMISYPFYQNGANGLLGMNFFKHFKFKIDQEENTLYLSPKRR